VKIEEEKGKGGMGLMVGYYLYLGLRTRQLCLTDPAWDNSPGGLRKILSQRYFLFLFFRTTARTCIARRNVIYNDCRVDIQ